MRGYHLIAENSIADICGKKTAVKNQQPQSKQSDEKIKPTNRSERRGEKGENGPASKTTEEIDGESPHDVKEANRELPGGPRKCKKIRHF
jgi:hypothetical protein